MNPNLEAFLRVMDPEDNQTGGGSACAVAGAMAAGLVGMVARLSIGRNSMPHPDQFYHQVDGEAQRLSRELFDGCSADAQAFDAVMQAYRLPKGTDTQREQRQAAIQESLLRATLVPLANARGSARLLELCEQLQGQSNPNADSDLECAWHLARAALLGCLSNARINLTSIKADEPAATLRSQLQELTDFALSRQLTSWRANQPS